MTEMLDVPYAEKDAAKALGARWDGTARRWYVPTGVDVGLFERWLPRPDDPSARAGQARVLSARPAPAGPSERAKLVCLPEHCYRCGATTRTIAGVLVPGHLGEDGSGFFSFDLVSGPVAAAVNGSPLAALRKIGRIRIRQSQQRPDGYLANACFFCDAMIGSFFLQEGLTEYMAEGGSYEKLIIGEIDIPVSSLVDPYDAWDDEDDDDADGESPSTEPGQSGRPAPDAAGSAASQPAGAPTVTRARRSRRPWRR